MDFSSAENGKLGVFLPCKSLVIQILVVVLDSLQWVFQDLLFFFGLSLWFLLKENQKNTWIAMFGWRNSSSWFLCINPFRKLKRVFCEFGGSFSCDRQQLSGNVLLFICLQPSLRDMQTTLLHFWCEPFVWAARELSQVAPYCSFHLVL